jgi:hypothetical protein
MKSIANHDTYLKENELQKKQTTESLKVLEKKLEEGFMRSTF